MRIWWDEVAEVRRGEKTVMRRPIEPGPQGSIKPCPVQAGGKYALERIEDVSRTITCPKCQGEEDDCSRCKGKGEVTAYERDRRTLEGEHVEVLSVTRQKLSDITDDDALLEGSRYECAEDVLDAFEANHDTRDPDTEVWRIEFRYSEDVDYFMARPSIGGATKPFGGQKIAGHGDYTRSPSYAIETVPVVPPRYLEEFAKEAERKRQEKKSLAERVAELEATEGPHQLASLEKRVDQLEKRKQRKAA